MTDLAGFLLARLADDEAAARAATPGPWTLWDRGVGWEVNELPEIHDGTTFRHEDAAHIARHDPARVLAEVPAKRQIVEHCAGMLRESVEWDEPTQATDAKHTLRLLAQPYADHPDFDPAWKVEP